MNNLTAAEQKISAGIKDELNKLSASGKAAVLTDISWAERHIGVALLLAFGLGAMFVLAVIGTMHGF